MYNLDAIIAVGYRVNSKRGTQFRQWATARLRDYLVEGHAVNRKRLEERNLGKAGSKPEEMETVKKVVISVLNGSHR